MTHTPTPWKIIARNTKNYEQHSYTVLQEELDVDLEEYYDDNYIIDNHPYYNTAPLKSDAEFIVKCVNAHDDLVAALQYILDRAGEILLSETTAPAYAILAKLKAQS